MLHALAEFVRQNHEEITMGSLVTGVLGALMLTIGSARIAVFRKTGR